MAPGMVESNQNGSTMNTPNRLTPSRLYRFDTPPSLNSLKKLCAQTKNQSDYPLSASVVQNIPVYDLARHSCADAEKASLLSDEWHDILLSGPGVLVLRNFITDLALINDVNKVFDDIISAEASSQKGDHFATSGNNSRIWNSFQKHALHDPSSFVQYYASPWLELVCEAWLGPAYQVTAQVNIVRPGGAPQSPHRDYHLGFQGAEQCSRFPKTMQIASQLLTLQGAVAHSDMPLESGPTRFLPFSQQFQEGFMAYRLPQFKQHFNDNWVSLPLKRGDAVFFNPALFHAAGENQSPLDRSANLLQISSAFGKPMEAVDNLAILQNCWSFLKEMHNTGDRTQEVDACVRAIASGYPFPTNLDRRPPAPGGMAPESEADLIFRALRGGWKTEEVVDAVRTIRSNSLS